ncbi:MAG TPA: hypothetical protein VFP74_02580 [Pseudolabrys sp.]|jgi:hypothetical protein|nr:hypothetical protein [Pseudolabrys sp.]
MYAKTLIAAAALVAFSASAGFAAPKTQAQCDNQSADAVVSCSTMSGPREARCIRNSTAQYKACTASASGGRKFTRSVTHRPVSTVYHQPVMSRMAGGSGEMSRGGSHGGRH